MPLTSIARNAELSAIGAAEGVDAAVIHAQATAALTLVDSYLLGVELLSSQQQLELEPVSISSTLIDVAHSLDRYAKQYGVDMEVKIAGRYEPVMAHHKGLKAALTSLGYALIEARAASEEGGRKRVVLAGHRNGQGIVAGMYGTNNIDPVGWRKALELCGTARQPLSTLLGTSGAGVFVADALAQAMETRVRAGRHGRQAGFAMTLMPSQQLQFV